MHRRPPRRVFKRQDVLVHRWRLPTRRQWTVLLVALGAVALLGNWLSLYVATRAKQHVAMTLWELAARPMSEPRGIVLPLFDGVALLGISLLMELRAMQIDLPIEVPHCGDLSDKLIDKLEQDETLNVRVYDVCVQAAEAYEVSSLGKRTPLFCDDVDICYKRFRSFEIKILSVVFSRFEELMLLDADTMFLQNPMSLWDLDKFTKTGTLFFPDRIGVPGEFLAERITEEPVTSQEGDSMGETHRPARSRLHEFVETFNRAPFQWLATVPRATENAKDAVQHGQHNSSFRRAHSSRNAPSDFLRHSHAWNLRSGRQADASLLLWSKVKQPRATAILGSFVTLLHAHRPPSYHEKEMYFLACEVADSDYAFSDFGVGVIGSDHRESERALCGDALQFYPAKTPHAQGDNAIRPLYISSDHIAIWNPDKGRFYRSSPQLAEHAPGLVEETNLSQECLVHVTAVVLTDREIENFRRRQKFYKSVENWQYTVAVGLRALSVHRRRQEPETDA
jgi:hypothetical protein